MLVLVIPFSFPLRKEDRRGWISPHKKNSQEGRTCRNRNHKGQETIKIALKKRSISKWASHRLLLKCDVYNKDLTIYSFHRKSLSNIHMKDLTSAFTYIRIILDWTTHITLKYVSKFLRCYRAWRCNGGIWKQEVRLQNASGKQNYIWKES